MTFSRPGTELTFQQAVQKLLKQPWHVHSPSRVENTTEKSGGQWEWHACRWAERDPACSAPSAAWQPLWLPAERSSFLIYLLKQKTGGSFPGRHYQVNFPNGKILLSGNSVISWLNMKSSVVKNTLKLLFLKRIQ